MFRKILAPYDLSPPSKMALEMALNLGAYCRAALKAVHVIFQNERVDLANALPLTGELIKHLRDGIERDLKRLSQKNPKKIRSIEVMITDGEPVPVILKAIVSQMPDLVAVGTHGRTGLSHVLLGSVAEKILRHSPYPVWVVRRKSRLPLKRVLVPVALDGGEGEALKRVAGLSRLFPKLEVDLLHVIQFSDMAGYFPDPFAGRTAINMVDLERLAERKLQAIAKRHPKLRIRPQIRVGQVASEIQKAAKSKKSDLVLISTHGRKGLSHLLLGSVAEQVIRYAPCDVLSFCPKDQVAHRLKIIRNIKTE